MSDFILNLVDRIADGVISCRACRKGIVIDSKELQNALNLSLGENAKQMLEIGIVQDELVKLGFKHHGEYLGCLVLEGRKLMVDLETNAAVLVWQSLIFSYKSPTWQQDLLAKVRS